MPILKFILPAAAGIAAVFFYKAPADNSPAYPQLGRQHTPAQKVFRDSIYIDNKPLPVTIYENMWMMREPADKNDSMAAKKMGIENYFTWQRRRSPASSIPELQMTDDGKTPFYIPPAQVLSACRLFEVWGNYCRLQQSGGISNVSLSNIISIEFNNSIPADTLAKLLRQYRLQLTQGNGPSGVYSTAMRRGEQIARISRKLRYHPFVKNILNYMHNQPPPPLD